MLLDTINNPDGHGVFAYNYLAFILALGLSKAQLSSIRILVFKEFVIVNLERPFDWARSMLWELDLS